MGQPSGEAVLAEHGSLSPASQGRRTQLTESSLTKVKSHSFENFSHICGLEAQIIIAEKCEKFVSVNNFFLES